MFGRRRRKAASDEADDLTGPTTSERAPLPVPAGLRAQGPWDVAEVDDPAPGRVDMGGLWLPGHPGMQLRVQVDQQTQQVASFAVVLDRGSLQVQAFAAPRNEGIWDDVRTELLAGMRAQGGQAEPAEGPFGTEVRAQVPVRLPDGRTGTQSVRFVGVDGPRWFLRGLFSGPAATDAQAAAPLEELFRGIVVVRGEGPMAPREPIPLRLPNDASLRPPGAEDDTDDTGDTDGSGDAAGGTDTPAAARRRPPPDPFTRGPEITEVR